MAKLKIGSKNIKAIPFYKEGTIHPSGTLTVSAQSGVYDVTNYAFVNATYKDLLDTRIEGTLSGTYVNSEITSINRKYAFAGLDITGVDLSGCSYIASSAFYACSSLTSVNLPNCDYIGSFAFGHCYSLTSIDLPNCSYIGNYAFFSCTSLTSVNLPNCSYIGNYAFTYCYSLTSINLPNCSYIGSSVFINCSSLTSLYLTSTSLVSLVSINAFYSTPLSKSTYTGTFGSIYVPSSLLTSYQTASNWSNYSSRFAGI